MFRVFRHKTGQSKDEAKTHLPLRKGVMDIPLRAKVSQEINDCFIDDLSMLKDKSPLKDLIKDIAHSKRQKSRKFRALDPTGKDCEFLKALSDPKLRISGFTNKMIRHELSNTDFGKKRTDKQLSGKVTRHFKLLRVHGIIRKLPKQNRYQLTLKGIKLTNSLNAFLASSNEDLMKITA